MAEPTKRPKTGVLLVNLGTPDEPTTSAVRRYLAEFLADPRVIDVNPIGRWFLLNLFILPFRPKKSAEAYRAIWREDGSPLLVFSRALIEGVRAKLDDQFPVALAMRYGNPSINSGLTELFAQGVDRIVVLALYPHYAASSTGSTLEIVYKEAAKLWNTPYIVALPPFYEDPDFIRAFAEIGGPVMKDMGADHAVFSFHGLPERHMRKSDTTGTHCLTSEDCCDQITDANRNCYRAQCFATARALAKDLGLSEAEYSITFQSRLGRTPWIRPYTDQVLPELAKQGKKRVAVFCPAFVADCLETLEEIGIRAKADFKNAGGDDLELVPSLNAHPSWVDAVVRMIEKEL